MNDSTTSTTAQQVARMLAGEVIAYDKDQPCPTEGDSRFVSIDLQWLIPAFVRCVNEFSAWARECSRHE